MAHGSRILLYQEQYLTGYRLARRALRYAETFVSQYQPNLEESAALMLVQGVYMVYLANIPDQLRYSNFLIDEHPGETNLISGMRQIETAIEYSPHFGSEAARTLLIETPWHLNEICRHLTLAQQMQSQFTGNPAFTAVFQGFLLRCGYPGEALAQNYQALAHFAGLERSMAASWH